MTKVRMSLAGGSFLLSAVIVVGQQIGDVGVIPFHLDQADIEAGRVSFD